VNDSDVPAFWGALGLPGLADVHVHFLPPRMLRRVWAYFDAAGPLVGVQWPIRYRWPDADRVAHLDKLGVRAFTALAYAHKPGMATDLNDWTLAFARETPGCVPSATFYPEPAVTDYVSSAIEAGARVFKVHLQVGGFDPLEASLTPVWGMLADARIPVVIHAGHAPMAAEYTGPEPISALLARHPRLTAIVAHMGSPDYATFLDLATTYEGVALDTTMVFTPFFEQLVPFPLEERPRLHDLGLAGKILLGSDFPNIPYEYAAQLEGLLNLDLGSSWLRAVCWDNFTALLGIP
jgi:predicted TIM-barrel fold metal-dependent hydrolase